MSDKKRWARAHMVGIENTTIPSFTPDLSALDEEGIRHDVDMAIRHGFTSTLVATETGLTFDEAQRFVSIVAEQARGRIGVSTSLLFDSFEKNAAMLAHAQRVGCQAVLLGYPANWYPTSPEQIEAKTREMLAGSDIAVVLYPSPHFNFQRLHPSGFPLETLVRLSRHENVVGVKVGDLAMMAELHHHVGQEVLLNCPIERHLPTTVLSYGQQWMGAGCYEVFQSPETRYLVEYFDLLRKGKIEPAMELYWRLTPARQTFEQQFGQTVMTGTYHWTQQKYYQWCVGGNGGFTRQPAMKLHQHEMFATKMAYRMIGIDPREPDEEFTVGRTAWARAQRVSPAIAHAP